MTIITYTLGFLFIALAAKKIGQFFSQIGLPYITGYLLAGVVAGPFVLNLLPKEASQELRYIDELSLAVIAFVAGNELYLKEIRGRLKSITAISASVTVVFMLVGSVTLFILTQFIPFAEGMDVISRIAVALLGTTVLLALSPASTIAVIQEVRAKGVFTKTLLGVTVTMDVAIILLFSVIIAIASALLTGIGFDINFVLLLLIDLGSAIAVGFGVGKLFQLVLATAMRRWMKAGVVLVVGYLIFFVSYWLIDFSKVSLPFEIHVEGLLVAMIAGFYVTNYTNHRDEFTGILHDISPAIYVAFFTLTGLSLKLDILLATWPIALALFGTRIFGIFLGSYAGGVFAGESSKFNRTAWMGLITQAGIALGLAREVAVEFPVLGDEFATMIISVVVLNEIFGPIFLKSALGRMGEANVPEIGARDEVRDVLIFGIEAQSMELARQLQEQNWQVVLADTDRSHVDRLVDETVEGHFISSINEAELSNLLTSNIDAVLALLEDDSENLKLLELAVKIGVPRLVVRPNDLAMTEQFRNLGALVIEPASAMVNILNQSIQAPQTAAILLHQDSRREMVQVTVSNPDVDGMLIRDLRLPADVLFLDITHQGQSIVPHGYTRINLKNEVTLLGQADSLNEAKLKLGF